MNVMTLDEIKNIQREVLTPSEVASVIGCDGQDVRVAARTNPKGLGFPVICIGSRVKIPKAAFVTFMEGVQHD